MWLTYTQINLSLSLAKLLIQLICGILFYDFCGCFERFFAFYNYVSYFGYFFCVYILHKITQKDLFPFLCNFLHCLIEAVLYCVLCVAVLVATRIYILQIKMTISPLHPSHYNIFLTNLRTLKTCGDSLFHGGCNQIAVTLHTHLNCIRFDRTIFNFPHAGFLGKETDSGLTD